MKKIIFLFICSLGLIICHAETAQQQFSKANLAYEQKDYPTAITLYENLLEQDYHNATVYYNLGNAYYRNNQLSHAILNYERALRLNPNDKTTQENLDFVESKTQDNITPLPKFFLKRWYNQILDWFGPNGWRISTLLLLALTLAALLIMLLGNNYNFRKWGLVGTVVIGCLTLFSFTNATIATHRVSSQKEAIVMPTMISIKSSPDASSMEKFILHEGTKVTIEEELNDWYQISIADGNKGWVTPNEIEKI